MKYAWIFIFLSAGLFVSGQTKKVCFSFDDMPFVSYGIKDTTWQKEKFSSLVKTLSENKVPAIGFVNGQKLFTDGQPDNFQIRLLKSWIGSGLEAGNHSYSHPDFNLVSYKEYTGDILKGEDILKDLCESYGRQLKYFRHPFLHVGQTKEKADSLDNFLKMHGYTTAPVTIDDEDYLFACAYNTALLKNDTALMSRIGHDYIGYMKKKIQYFENQSEKLFGRKISQVLLIHASALNSDYISSLINLFRSEGYLFVSMDEALGDNAYLTPVTVYGKWGISWLDKWALSQGKKGDFFSDDPESPDYIKSLCQ